MASQSEPVTTYDVPNYAGEAFYVGATFGKSPLLSMAGLTTGYKTANSGQFPMANTIAGDTPAQDGQAEDDSIAAMTDTSFTASQDSNYLQIFRKTYIVSYAAEALQGAISGVATMQGPQAVIGSMPVQRLAHMKQMMADYEYSALYGTKTAWTNAATAGKMGGLLTYVEAGSETAAGGAVLSKTLIQTEIERMAAAGAEFGDMVIACGAHQNMALNELYGNALQSDKVAGVNIQRLLLPLLGEAKVVYDPVLATDDLAFIDMSHFDPVFGLVPGKPPIFVEPLAKTAAGNREQLYALASIDYGNILYHGMVSGLATS